MASREEILADFQACTGIDDVGDAISQLEEAGWVLVDAVNKAMPGSSPHRGAPAAAAIADDAPMEQAVAVADAAAVAEVAAELNRPPSPPARTDSMMPATLPPPLASLASSASSGSRRSSRTAGTSTGGSDVAGQGSSFSNVSMADDFFSMPGPSSINQRVRMLEFYIQYLDRQIHLRVPDNSDVKTLKQLIQNETSFPPCQQILSGFRSGAAAAAAAGGVGGVAMTPHDISHPSDRRRLSHMNLPKENFLTLVRAAPVDDDDVVVVNGGEDEAENDPESKRDFKLYITDETISKQYVLNFRPTQTVLGVKLDVHSLTHIPVSKQVWTGWPEHVNDDLSLVQLGLPRTHRLSVNRKASPARNVAAVDDDGAVASGSGSRDMPVVVDDDDSAAASTSTASTSANGRRNHQRASASASANDASMTSEDDEDEEFEDANSEIVMMDDEDEMFGAADAEDAMPGSTRAQPLLPDDYGDEAMAAIKFGEEFEKRYGKPVPGFFPGTLEDAVKEACVKPAKERKMLAMYFHHDSSVLANVFCTQALCAESVVAFLNENFVSFGWDLTYSSNKQRAIDFITRQFGSVAAATLRRINIEKLPVLALVYRLRGTTEIFKIIHGNVTLDELMSQLLTAQDIYSGQLAVEIQEEDAREARNAVKREQDEAFEMAQQADRLREAEKQREEEAKLEQERIDEAVRRSQQEAQEKEEEEKERARQAVKSRLPEEPKAEEKHARIRFRVCGHSGRNLERRFLPNDALSVLMDYLASEGFPQDEYKVLSSWPRRDLTAVDQSQTLEALKLYPQEMLTLEEK